MPTAQLLPMCAKRRCLTGSQPFLTGLVATHSLAMCRGSPREEGLERVSCEPLNGVRSDILGYPRISSGCLMAKPWRDRVFLLVTDGYVACSE